MKMMGASALLACVGAAIAQDGTGRDLLFSDPTANLPDVKISESVKYVNEGSSFYYTVELTHMPGMREDQTVDLANDEVRIYLSSSQEVYQQGVAATDGTVDDFVQTLGHRTQLVIDTNVVRCESSDNIQTGAMGRYTDPNCFSDATSTAAEKLTDGWCLDVSTGITTSKAQSACTGATERFTPTSAHIMGPLPYVYVAYSTKNPSQPSIVVNNQGSQTNQDAYQVVCPLCTHSKFCTMHATDIIVGSNEANGVPGDAGADVANFDGCLKVTYNGFAPAYDACFANDGGAAFAATTAASDPLPATIAAAANRIKVGTGGASGSPTNAGEAANKIKHCMNVPTEDFDGVSYTDDPSGTPTKKLLLEPVPMGRGYLDEDSTNYGNGVLSPALATGGVGSNAVDVVAYVAEETDSSSTTLMPGNSDFRITASGGHARRRIKDYSPYCRYCEMPGVICHNKDGGSSGQVTNSAVDGTNDQAFVAMPCPDVEINGGDTAPGSCTLAADGTFSYSDGTDFGSSEFTSKYDCEAASTTGATTLFEWDKSDAAWRGWRGDVSSGAQLVFDSTNWNIPQTVKVTARDDDVYEPEVFGRGQDAYVHHYVVAQDQNLQHTYYDDIDVNSLTVSITDNDAAVVLETASALTPTELSTYGAPSTLSVMASNAVAAAHSTGCTDPQHKDYNKCLAASSCTGPCNGATANAAQEGATADTCLVSMYTTQAECEAVQVEACYVDALGSARFDSCIDSSGASTACTEVLCEGTDGGSTGGTCVGSGPSTATTCTDATLNVGGTGSACLTKTACENAGFEWHSHGRVWIGASGAGATTWAANKWGGAKTGATSVPNAADEIVLQLASEPMYDVTVYVQSGAFFTTENPSSPDDFQPDDEQVIFQDKGQATTCVTVSDGTASDSAGVLASNRASGAESVAAAFASHSAAVTCVADATTVPMCDPTGYFVSSQQYLDRRANHATVVALPLATEGSATEGLSPGANTLAGALADAAVTAHPGAVTGPERGLSATGFTGQKLPTKGHDEQSCRTLTTEADCVAASNAGCVWATNKCTMPAPSAALQLTAKDLMCTSLTAGGADAAAKEALCDKIPGCAWDGRTNSAGCVAHRTGFDCNSFLTFSSTNWNVPQTLMAIAVADDDDETPSGTCTSSAGVVDYSITTAAACAQASKTWTADTEPANTGDTPYGVDPSEVGYLIVSDDWYYNSAGAELIDDAKLAYHPIVDGATGYCTTTATGLIDFTKTTEADCDTGTGRTQTWQWTGPAAGVSLSMFDTRFGDHINRYPYTFADVSEYGASGTKAVYDHAAAPNFISWNGNARAQADGDATALGSERVGCAAVAYATTSNVVLAETGSNNVMRKTARPAVTSGEVRLGCPLRQGVRGTPSPIVTIASITAADPAVATVASTTITDGSRVRISGVGDTMGTDLLNGNTYYVTVTAGNSGVDATELTLYTDSARTVGVDSSGKTATGNTGTMSVDFTPGGNKVCLNKEGYFDGAAAHSSVQVTSFSPGSYSGDGVTCGATSYTQDKNARGVVISRSACEVTEGRRHYYSNTASNNRHAANMLLNPSSLGNQLGLLMPYESAMDDWSFSKTLAIAAQAILYDTSGVVTFDDTTPLGFKVGDSVIIKDAAGQTCPTGQLQNCAAFPCTVTISALSLNDASSTMTFSGISSASAALTDNTLCTVERALATAPQDGWSSDWASTTDGGAGNFQTALGTYDVSNAVMSMPVCPFTIALTSAPAEGATVVVKVGEDENLASLRDNELYFYEEPTFRVPEAAYTGAACGTAYADCGATGPFSSVANNVDEFKTDGTTAENLAINAVACERMYPGSITAYAGQTDETANAMCYINNVGSAVDEAIALTSVTSGARATAKVVITPGSTAWSVLSAMEVPKVGDTIEITPVNEDSTQCEIAGTYTLQAVTCAETAGPPQTFSCTEFFTDQPLIEPTAAAKCMLSKPYRPNGGKTINVKFTDDDWNVPRRITVIALNDDVDEPLETRKVYFTNGWTASGTWQGVGSGPGVQGADCQNCVEDPFWRDTKIGTIGTLSKTYAGPPQYTATGQYEVGSAGGTSITGTAIVETQITVDVVDDDIADLVVLCGAGGGMPGVHTAGVPAAATAGHGMAQTESLDFLGSYDDALDYSEDNRIMGLEIDGTINRIGASSLTGIDGKTFLGGSYGGTTADWVPDVTTVGVSSVISTESITLASGKGALFAVGDRIQIASCGTTAAVFNGYHTITGINGDVLTFAEGAAGYVVGTAATDAHTASCTVQGAIKREGYEAEDGVAQGVQYSFGGGIVKSTAADVGASALGGALTTKQSITSSILCSKYNAFDAAGDADNAATALACATEAAVQDGCVVDSNVCVGGTATGTPDNTFYSDTSVDWTTYDPYHDRYIIADGYTPTNQGVLTAVAANFDGSMAAVKNGVTMTHHNRGFKGVGPALTEGPDNYACTIHTRECEYDPPKGSGITHGESGFCYTIADNEITADDRSTCDGAATKAWGYYKDSSDIDADSVDEDSRAYGTVDVGDEACHNKNVGSFKIRLNSSPGQKTVKRQYIGETTTVYEKELVYIVVTPDATAQTQFSPASVTFTETGGLVNGVATQRWDKPATVEVRPVDDKVDERRGVTVDFTAFSIKQSHETDDYWTYTTPYMNIPVSPADASTGGTCNSKTELGYCADSTYTCAAGSTGSACDEKCKTTCEAAGFAFVSYPATGAAHAWGDAATFRVEDHTPYRHTIRTVHTHDNDYAGVTVRQPTSGGTDADVAEDQTKGRPGSSFTVAVTEGGTFGYYTLELDSQPALIQRQAGTSPNKDIAFSATCDHDGASGDVSYKSGGYANSFDGSNYGDYYLDNTKLMRSSAGCGSVVPPEYYWVDVTATQTIQLDLATPASCPAAAPWGGGSSQTIKTDIQSLNSGYAAAHPRFPLNAKQTTAGIQPYDEVNYRGQAMEEYLPTCGGWQRDATYRFTAKDWNVPQYVYFYAHNDKDGIKAVPTAISAQALSAVDTGPEARLLTTNDPAGTGFAVGDKIRLTTAANTCDIAGYYTVEAVTSTTITVAELFLADEDTAADCQVQRDAVTGGTDGIGAEVVDSGLTTYATTIKHYVETEDTQDNMAPTAPIAAVAATAVSGKVLTVAVNGNYAVGDRVRIVENSVGTDCDDAVGEYTIASLTTTAVTFLETIGTAGDVTHCSLIGGTGRCTDQGTQTTAQAAATGKAACAAAGGEWTPSFVQRNKHGGIYTYGNLERYPFGRHIPYTDSQNALAYHHETGFTTYGYTSYESLYGYTMPGAVDNAKAYASGSNALGVDIGTACGPTQMGLAVSSRTGTGSSSDNSGASVYIEPGTTTACVDMFGDTAPYQDAKRGLPCVPASGSSSDLACVPTFAENSGTRGVAGFQTSVAADEAGAIILAASGSGDRSGATGTGGGYEEGTATGTALNNPPKDVIAQVTDNDDITEQATAAIAGCRATTLFQYADSTGTAGGQQTTAVGGRGVFKKEWLTDYNCDSGDAGGLPGYPLSPTRGDGTAIAGYCTDGVQVTKSACIAEYFCTVPGRCVGDANAPTTATVQGECGTCATAANQPTATDRFTQAECVKDSDGDGSADGTWTAGTDSGSSAWVTSDATEANCASVLGGVWKARTWIDAPTGDATTGWQAVKAATEAAVAATSITAATKTFATADITAGVTTAFAAGDRVLVSANGANSCSDASCPICGTYHIAAINTNNVVFVEAFTSTATGDATHCSISRPAVTLQDINRQCCSCVPATGSTVTAESLSVHKTESECTTDSAGARLGGTWVCAGVGPYCTTD